MLRSKLLQILSLVHHSSVKARSRTVFLTVTIRFCYSVLSIVASAFTLYSLQEEKL